MSEQTQLLSDYFNSFNLETRTPFELSQDRNVPATVYNVSVIPVRNISVGYLEAGSYVNQSTNQKILFDLLLVKIKNASVRAFEVDYFVTVEHEF